jgi:hypothetical protein
MTKGRSTALREFGVYVTYERVFHQKARDGDMRHFLAGMPLEHALQFFGSVSALVFNFKGASFFEFQKGLVSEMSSGLPYAKRLSDLIAHPNIFVNSEQLAVLQKFSMMYCAPEGSPLPTDFNDRLLRVMLAYNSMRGLEDINPRDTERAMLITELRSMFNASALTSLAVDLYWRFFKWSQSREAQASENFLNVLDDFTAFFGMTPTDYSTVAFAFLAHYLRLQRVSDLKSMGLFISVKQYLQNVEHRRTILEWLTLNAITIGDATASLRDRAPRFSGFSLKPLLDCPMVYVQEDTIYCPHIPFLENKIGAAQFFLLLDGYNAHDGNRVRSDKFTRFFGDFFEDYCLSLARASHRQPELVFGEMTCSHELCHG